MNKEWFFSIQLLIYIYTYIFIYIYNHGSTQTYSRLNIYNHHTPRYSKGIWE